VWLNLIAIALILSITFFQALQGMYAAVTLALCTLVAATLAFALQGTVAALLAPHLPELAQAIALGAVFLLVLLPLKLIADQFLVRSRIGFPMLVDRIGGACFGLFASMLMVGMVAICVQLLPVSAKFLGFQRCSVIQQEAGRYRLQTSNLWLNPDGFTVGVVSFLSRGSLAGSPAFGAQHPDYLEELYWRRAGIPMGSRRYVGGAEGGLKVIKAWKGTEPPLYTATGPSESWTFKEAPTDPSDTYLVARVKLDASIADSDNLHRFTPYQFRLVGHIGHSPRECFAVAVCDVVKPAYYVLHAPDALIGAPVYPGGTYLDVVFRIDADFQPDFIEYKSGARAELAATTKEPLTELTSLQSLPGTEKPAAVARAEREERPAAGPAQPEPKPEEPQQPRVETPHQPGRAVESVTIEDTPGTGVTAKLPYEIRISQGASSIGAMGDNEVSGGRFLRGWFAGPLTSESGGLQIAGPGTERVEFFLLPTEQPQIMVQLRGRSTGAQTNILRSVFNSVRMMKQYSVVDDHSHEYMPAGYFALTERGGDKYVELHYYPDIVERRGMMIWQSLQRREVEQAEDVGLIYLVDPGPRRLVRFSSQSSFFRQQTLRIDIPAEMPPES
jgi:uncharacterized membrane protein required for colicin V production